MQLTLLLVPALLGVAVDAVLVRPLPTLPQTVTSPYAPVTGSCPAGGVSIRNASGLSRAEASWVAQRQPKAKLAMYSWLKTLNLSATDMMYYNRTYNTSTKNVDVAISGGGYRSLLIGAGVIEAIDGREKFNATNSSAVAGFLQGTTYLSGLSGGAWLVSSIIGNNYSTVSNLQTSLWEAEFQEGLALNEMDPGFELQITEDITLKSIEFDTSINDPWGRLLSYQLLKGTDGGVTTTLSGISNVTAFANYSMPFPLLQALGVKPSDCRPGPNATQYEFSPFEFGSWDSGVQAFVPTKYVGSNFTNGQISDPSSCVTGYDNLGFVLGTSSCLFSALDACSNINGSITLLAELAEPLLEAYMVETTGSSGNDALYPNPFKNISNSYLVNTQDQLKLVDGGLSSAAQNIPLWSLIQSSRNASLILAVDNSADTGTNFPNGSEILNTYVQSLSANLSFPVIPPVSTFLAQNLTQKPTLFGCGNTSVPTIVYLANAQHGAFPANQSTFTLIYQANQTDAMIRNGFNGMTQNNNASWARCLGCFVIYEGNRGNATNATASATATTAQAGRASASASAAIGMSSECASCFDQYCYN